MTKGKTIHVRYLDRENEWKTVKGKLTGKNIIDCKDKQFVFNVNGMTRIPTIWKQLGLSSGTKPCVVAYEENPYIFLWDDKEARERNAIRRDSSFNLKTFQNLQIGERMVASSRRGTPDPFWRYVAIVGLSLLGLLILLGVYFGWTLGLFDASFWQSPGGR